VFRRYPLQAVMTGLIVASFPGRKGGK
jgi:hypothetical protein